MKFNMDLGKSFDHIVFVEERDAAEKMISEGWTAIWDPEVKLPSGVLLPKLSQFFILVAGVKQGKQLDPCREAKQRNEMEQ